MKVYFGYVNEVELMCSYDAPGVLSDELFISALRAKQQQIYDKKTQLQRLQLVQESLGIPKYSLNLYYTYDKVVNYEILETRSTIRKVKKYSGYVRNSSSVGSKRSSGSSKPEPESFEWTYNEKFDYFEFLSVGVYSWETPRQLIDTLMRTKSSKRDQNLIIKNYVKSINDHLNGTETKFYF